MAKKYNSEELVGKMFFIAMCSVGLFIVAVFLFIL